MCSIMGMAGHGIPRDKFDECFRRTKSRGPDETRIDDFGAGVLGFHRLAIMGLTPGGMQPFELSGSRLVCNGEIYGLFRDGTSVGFRTIKSELAEEFVFSGDSDCEILLPLYKKYGNKLFAMLDAEFALIIYDARTGGFAAARDPIGIRPLFWGDTPDGGKIFASEAKNLVGLCEHIMPFPPGHYWADGKLVCYRDIAARAASYTTGTTDEICRGIHDRLVAGVRKRLDSDAPMGFLLSGGLDSSLVCAIAQRCSDKPIRTFAIGMDEDAIDLKYAREAADYIGSAHTEVIINRKDVENALENVSAALGTYDITTMRASVGMYLVCRAIHRDTDIRVLLTGEISDEIFGYKYTDFAPDAEAFQTEAEKRLRELYMYDVLRADRCISVNSLEARVPFGDLGFVEYVMSIDPAMKLNTYGKGKYLLRRAFEEYKLLPPDLLWREKAAFSDAVGHSLADHIRAYAESRYTDSEFEARCAVYTHSRPFTKESLLYRELFEKFYPEQSEMVADFWMPNKDWEGCNVSDPSARVLSNYGASGV